MTAEGVVLDSSALLAVLYGEPGAPKVADRLEGALMSTANLIEVIERYTERGLSIAKRRAQLEALGIRLVPLSAWQAELAAALWSVTRDAGLSLADRACLALALTTGRPAVTADRSWRNAAKAVQGLRVDVIR